MTDLGPRTADMLPAIQALLGEIFDTISVLFDLPSSDDHFNATLERARAHIHAAETFDAEVLAGIMRELGYGLVVALAADIQQKRGGHLRIVD